MELGLLPILYSYRRCPYAMRARMALALADIAVEIREISLREKPAHMLEISPKATVPVLMLPEGKVIEESLEIMVWALKEHATGLEHSSASLGANIYAACRALIVENDNDFKRALDAYKYPERNKNKTQIEHRADGVVFLQKLEILLQKNPNLFGEETGIADMAIFPFIRQFAAVDIAWWETAHYPKLRAWLNEWLSSELFKSVMQKRAVYVGGASSPE